MANQMTKKEYDEVKGNAYTVRSFALEHGRQVAYCQYVGIKEAFDFCVEQQKLGHFTIMDLHYKMMFAYVQDGTVITDYKMTQLLLNMYDEMIEGKEETGLIGDKQKVEYLQKKGYIFFDAYNLGKLHKEYNNHNYKDTETSAS